MESSKINVSKDAMQLYSLNTDHLTKDVSPCAILGAEPIEVTPFDTLIDAPDPGEKLLQDFKESMLIDCTATIEIFNELISSRDIIDNDINLTKINQNLHTLLQSIENDVLFG